MAYYKQTLTTTLWLVLACLLVKNIQSNEVSTNNKNDPKLLGESYECKQRDFVHANGDSGTLLINRLTSSCGFIGQDETSFFGIETTNLKMTADEYIQINPDSETTNVAKLYGPFAPGYLLIGLKEPTIQFFFKTVDNSTAEVKFIQNKDIVPFNCDTKADLQIKLVGLNKFTALFAKSIVNPIHVKFVNLDDKFNHHLMTTNTFEVPIRIDAKSTPVQSFDLTYEPGLAECSKLFQDDKEASYELAGPQTSPQGAYSCINIFKTNSKSNQSHFDVDFANFIKLSNSNDELIIDDGANLLKIAMFSSSDYAKKVISFSGQNLAVIYNSPGPIKPTNVGFKLTVRAREIGGLINTDKQQLTLPATKGSAFYTLQPSAGLSASLELTKISGLQLKISDDFGKSTVLDNPISLPPLITSSQPDSPLYLSIISGPKPSGTIKFQSVQPNCGGLFYDPLGSISLLNGGNKTCYWLLGAQTNSLLSIKNNQLTPNSCLTIVSLNQVKPLYDQCNINQKTILPDIVLGGGGPSYVRVQSKTNGTKFDASIGPAPAATVLDFIEGQQRTVHSIGYPISYVWSSQSDTITLDNVNKSAIISIADLDIRTGESLSINDKIITGGDVDISNKTTNVTLKRSFSTNDFSFHRGYKLVVSTYQTIMLADISKDSITTSKNLTSVLIRVPAGANLKRISYNITFSAAQQNYQMAVIDSRTLLGRQVYPEEKIHGSTTSDTLLVSIIATANQTIPKLTIQYNQLACNQTTDHVCDNSTRCVPADKLCKGKVYCDDQSDLRVVCSSGPMPAPKIIEKGVAGVTVFILFMIGIILGVIGTLYGPDFYKSIEGRLRSSQYTTFTSTE